MSVQAGKQLFHALFKLKPQNATKTNPPSILLEVLNAYLYQIVYVAWTMWS